MHWSTSEDDLDPDSRAVESYLLDVEATRVRLVSSPLCLLASRVGFSNAEAATLILRKFFGFEDGPHCFVNTVSTARDLDIPVTHVQRILDLCASHRRSPFRLHSWSDFSRRRRILARSILSYLRHAKVKKCLSWMKRMVELLEHTLLSLFVCCTRPSHTVKGLFGEDVTQ